jgi:hypothetical protein
MYLITTTQRCGSTWLTRMLADMTSSQELYVDCLQMGFRLSKPRQPGAVEKLADFLRSRPEIRVFKTHDVPSSDFDILSAAIPELRILTMRRDFKDVVVSRYFYTRHHWPTQPALGTMPPPFAEYLAQVGNASDREALPLLLDAKVLRGWAREWAAFEGAFSTHRGLRLQYIALLDGSAHSELESFTGLPLPGIKPFEAEQQDETLQTGRSGSARFHRNGRAGQWHDWFSSDEGKQLDALAAAAMEKYATSGWAL